MNIIFVGIGGACGSLARYSIGKFIAQRSDSVFPLGTFAVNILGPLLLGLLMALHVPASVYMLLGDGFLGAFTTFSTFMYEGITLFKDSEKKSAAAYITITVVLGLIVYMIGFTLGGLIFN